MTLNLDAYWMPYTGNRQFKRDPRIIQSAQGVCGSLIRMGVRC